MRMKSFNDWCVALTTFITALNPTLNGSYRYFNETIPQFELFDRHIGWNWMICCALSCVMKKCSSNIVNNNKCSSIQLFIKCINRHSTEIHIMYNSKLVECFWLRHGLYKCHKQFVMWLSLHMTCTMSFLWGSIGL